MMPASASPAWKDWTTDQVIEWLGGENLAIKEACEPSWREYNVNGKTLPFFDEKTLKEDCGVTFPPHRKSILSAIRDLTGTSDEKDDGGDGKMNASEIFATLANLKKRLNDIETRDSFVVSYSNYYNEKLEQSRVTLSKTEPAEGMKNNLCQCLLDAQKETGGKKEKVKPFWKKFMEEKQEIVPGIKNVYEAATLGSKTPDICFFDRHVGEPSAESFIAVGECQGENWSDESCAEKGQIMLYLRKILDAQPNRPHAYGFVTNNNIFVLVKAYRASRSPFAVYWDISRVLDYVDGMALFVEVMRKDSGYRANPTFKGHSVSVGRPLRPGGSCRAYLGRFQGGDVVVKVYSSCALAEASNENILQINSALKNTNQGGATLPKTLGWSDKWLLVRPIGKPFTPSSFSCAHLKCVLHTLEQIHEAGYVHRDVRMANMFDLGDGEMLLDDWGSLAAKGKMIPYEGCPTPYKYPSVDGVASVDGVEFHTPLPKHDLYSLVYASAKLVAPGFNDDAILNVFGDAFRAVENVDYSGVYRSMKPLLFD